MNESEEIIDIDDNEIKADQLIKSPLTKVPSPTMLPASIPTNHDMDEESRKLIEQMLAEEEYYYGRNTITTLESAKKRKRKALNKKTSDQSKKRKKEATALSSASLPSHNTRWNEEEDDLLKKALTKFGYGNWKLISEYVKTRNPLQCKNHARHLQQTDKIESNLVQTNKQNVSVEIESPIITLKKEEPLVEEEKEIDDDILSIDDNDNSNEHKEEEDSIAQVSKGEDEVSIDDEIDLVEDKVPIIGNSDIPGIDDHTPSPELEHEDDTCTMAPSPVTTHTDDSIINNTHTSPDTLNTNDDTQKDEEPLTNTVEFSPNEITEDERIQNPEWFRHKHSKTPDRYLKIRNHILACWKACRPRYLTKTSARKGLKDCGDVNAIGRVHEYLESIGAINVGCVTSAPRPPRRVPREQIQDDDMFHAADLVINYDGPRKRKVRNEHGEWVDPRELEGRVIEHQVIVRLDTKPKRVIKRIPQYYGGDDFGRGYDPFRLVPTEHYNHEGVPPPFEVEINSDALLVMDFHSHLAHTEIIGLLGGNFIKKGETKILQVKTVFPCRSTSTGIQCEMDPASEMKAREWFAEKGYNVVGWYHSHPTFEPHPSIRDIENQTSYQTLFKEETGDEPFIGVIVTPYDPEILSEYSQIQYLHISKEWDELHSFRVPYACRKTVLQNEQVSSDILHQFTELVNEYKDYEHKVNMLSDFGSQTRLEKLLDSLRAHLFIEKEDEKQFIDNVRHLILNDFIDEQQQREKINHSENVNNE
ncbi:uncharacterized protein BX663DRAFT_462573 [Cokeromyces recurvatus]|uniref:uncharacterized protein n=1 Tax=Cokeromyces recurvatus TaxID=90255 RepID=UPI00221EE60D|nr:uncharacterized protein BX663DRAFT_462573 [Cokeromyces recurvatus]KAI7898016.1 hypothetical protein BX663DRAFT_462573 [Cokeromyces recurvatus]